MVTLALCPPPLVGDIATYIIEGRRCHTFQEVRAINEAGDVLTDKDGWLPAGTFTFRTPLPPAARTPSAKDGNIFAAGRDWFFQGHAPAKEKYKLTPIQLRNGPMRARREVARAEKKYKQALATTPPLFYEQPAPPAPRYTTAEGANQHVLDMRDNFVASRRQFRAQQIHKLRARLAAYPPAVLEQLHTTWQARRWACGLEYLADFLTQQDRARKHEALRQQMQQLKASLHQVGAAPRPEQLAVAA